MVGTVGSVAPPFAEELVKMAEDHYAKSAGLSYKIKTAMEMGRFHALIKMAAVPGIADDVLRLLGKQYGKSADEVAALAQKKGISQGAKLERELMGPAKYDELLSPKSGPSFEQLAQRQAAAHPTGGPMARQMPGTSVVPPAGGGTVSPGTVAAKPGALGPHQAVDPSRVQVGSVTGAERTMAAVPQARQGANVKPMAGADPAFARTLPPGQVGTPTPATSGMRPSTTGAAAPPAAAPAGPAVPSPGAAPTPSPTGAPQQMTRLQTGMLAGGIGLGGAGLGAGAMALSNRRGGGGGAPLPTPRMPSMISKVGEVRIGISKVGGLGLAWKGTKALWKRAPKWGKGVMVGGAAAGLGATALGGYGAYRAGKSQMGVHHRAQHGAYRHGGYTAKPWMRSHQM